MKNSSQTEFFSGRDNTSSGGAYLTVYDGDTVPQEYNLDSFGKDIITFGRAEGNDILLSATFVSRRHGQIKRLSGGVYVIEDCDSTNGLVLDGKKIASYALQEGNAIKIEKRGGEYEKSVLIAFSRESNNAVWQTFSLLPSTEYITIGRGEHCDIRLDHISVSRVHAIISQKGDKYYLTDNSSTNGVIVNGVRTGHCQLNEKDMIIITNSKLIFSRARISYCVQKRGIGLDSFNVSKKVGKQNKIICNNITLSVNPCEFVAIVGGSGAGKSTFMNCLSGFNRPTDGVVSVNGVNLFDNFSALKNIIGYVPQSDIVHDNLTLEDMLKYASKLRLPEDVSVDECAERIEHVISMVELEKHKDTLIKRLSGGQRKRASIAVELLSDPNLFFLDEPTSGLDPSTERNLVRTLRNMADKGKTVIFVTHSPLSLGMCDKIAFIGTGGHLCFYGSVDEALKFFGVSDVVDVYNIISAEPEKWRKTFDSSRKLAKSNNSIAKADVPSKIISRKFIKQTLVLARRYLHIMFNDRVRTLLILLQAPLLGLLIAVVANGDQFELFDITQSLTFALACSAFWIGILNSIQEVCKERNILRREHMTGLRLDAYVISKMLVLAIACLVQSLGLIAVFSLLVGLPAQGVFSDIAVFEIFAVTFLGAFAASAMGILVSAGSKNSDIAMTIAPILLMPQLLFSGIIFELEGVTNILSFATVTRWVMQSYGTTANFNELPLALPDGLYIPREHESIFEFTQSNALISWGALGIITALCVVVAILFLRKTNKGSD